MLDNQRFFKADSRIIFIKVLNDHCSIGGPMSPIREAVSWSQNPNMFGQLFTGWNHGKRYHPKLSILWTTRLSSHSLGFLKLTVLLWMMAIVCALYHLLALIFYVLMPSKRLGLSVLSYRKSDRTSVRVWSLLLETFSWLKDCLTWYFVLSIFQLYLWTKQKLPFRCFVIILDSFQEMDVA